MDTDECFAHLCKQSKALVQMVLGIGHVHLPALMSALHHLGFRRTDCQAMHRKRGWRWLKALIVMWFCGGDHFIWHARHL